MRSNFFLSALIFATVQSCSRSVMSRNTSPSSVGGDVVSSAELSLLISESAAELELRLESRPFRFGFEPLRWPRLELRLEELVFDEARIILGIMIAAAIPSTAKTTNTIARIPRTQGHVLRLL